MEGMMRQMVMAGPRKSKIIEVPIPKYSDDEMLVKVTLTGMCHSELYPWATAKEGDILGHEAIGVVAEVGKNVRGFRAGDRVTGLGGGAYKEYIVVSPAKTAHVPDCLKDEDAISEPLVCLLSTAMKLPVETLGDTVAVVGCGYMGLGHYRSSPASRLRRVGPAHFGNPAWVRCFLQGRKGLSYVDGVQSARPAAFRLHRPDPGRHALRRGRLPGQRIRHVSQFLRRRMGFITHL